MFTKERLTQGLQSATLLQASLDSKTKALRRAEQSAVQRAEHAQHELAVARRECDRSAGDAEDRRVQLSVLVETVETLQAGTPGDAHSPCMLALPHIRSCPMQPRTS